MLSGNQGNGHSWLVSLLNNGSFFARSPTSSAFLRGHYLDLLLFSASHIPSNIPIS
jgi:hypothetical protein